MEEGIGLKGERGMRPMETMPNDANRKQSISGISGGKQNIYNIWFERNFFFV